ncbi:MAG: CoB--CoM heterodisulfide reductase iron-sulfur subunit B family protein [Candidatus Thermoplasmatota archaeon]|nr:CoB--CoM heterodisulfide reductase iron-sulfur subunit B family protein [Candidatus Thermoplasmatota archaeon]
MKLLYYPGCTLKTSAKNLERSAFAVMEALGHEMVEMEDWNCCGVVASLTDDDLMHHLAPLRSLIHVEDQGEDKVVTLCDMCCNTLKQTNLRVKENSDDLETLNAFMDRENDYKGTVTVIHFLEFLRDEIGFDVIKKKVKRPLKGIRIMPYYGCMLLRPREVAIDDAEEPTILGDLLSALGAEVIDNPFKIECCGSYHTVDEKESVSKRAHRITNFATEGGSDAMVLSCPLCRFNLDARGKEAEKMFKDYKQIPVFYYTQLIAIALGLDQNVCGFDQHVVDPLLLLKKKGVFEKEDKIIKI